MESEKIVSPHHDIISQSIKKGKISGFRENIYTGLMNSYKCIQSKEAKHGFLSAVCSLTANTMPGAYLRAESIAVLQFQFEQAKFSIGHDLGMDLT